MEDLINKDNNQIIKNKNNENDENDEIQTDNKENEDLKKLKILEEKINSHKLKINEYDNQFDQLRNNGKVPEKSLKTVEEKESIKSRQKLTKNLKLKSKSLYINLKDLQDKQNHIKLGTSIDLPQSNQNKDKLRNIKQEEEIIKNKLSEIHNQIKLNNEKMISIPKIKIQKRYADEIENKDYINNNLPTSILKSSNTTFFKSLDEIMQKEKEEIAEKALKKVEKLKIFRFKELEIVKNRKNRIDNLSKINTHKYIIRKDYLSPEEKEQKRLMEEEWLVDREKRIRRMKLFPISSEELDLFSKNVKKNEKIIQEELGTKKIQMKQLWQLRKNLLPEYKSKFYDHNKEKEKEDKERELKLKEEKNMREMKKKHFVENIIKKCQPNNNYILQNEREEKIKKLLGKDKMSDIKELENKIKLNSKKISLIQPKNFDTSKKLSITKASGRKKIKKLIPLERPIDYLNDNEKGIQRRNKSPENNSYSNMNKWKNMLKDDNEIYNNIEKIKTEANILKDKAEAKKQILEYKKNSRKIDEIDELNNEISNLYIASLQAKFQILKKIGKNV